MLIFGDPYWAFAWVCFYAVVFGVIGLVIYAVLTRDTAISALFRQGLDKTLQLSRRTALCLILPGWLVASLWVYQSRLASKYHTLERVESAAGVVWELTYFQPHRLFYTSRVVRVPQEHITQWRIGEEWHGAFPQPALVMALHEGITYGSMGMLHRKFGEECVDRLRAWGVEVQRLSR
jgi:hypothetical protein